MSSFQKLKIAKIIPGTKVSLQNGQLLTSCGNPSLDHIIGGGMPIGSIMLIEEDKFVTYSRVLAKYFMAEGASSDHTIFLGCLDEEPTDFIKKLPSAIEEQGSGANPMSPPLLDDEMRIAWRYNTLPKVQSEQTSLYMGHNFDLTKQITEQELDRLETVFWGSQDAENHPLKDNMKLFKSPKNYSILDKLASQLKDNVKFATGEGLDDVDRSVIRICLNSIGSPLWYDENFATDFIKFLTILKSIVRNHLAVCFVTIPIHLLRIFDEHLVPRIRNLVDFSIELESFAGSEKETNPAFKEYNGLLHIRKMTALNSLATFTPETTDLAFKLKRKKFVIEKLHLPPELQTTEQREQDDTTPTTTPATTACGSAKPNPIDF